MRRPDRAEAVNPPQKVDLSVEKGFLMLSAFAMVIFTWICTFV